MRCDLVGFSLVHCTVYSVDADSKEFSFFLLTKIAPRHGTFRIEEALVGHRPHATCHRAAAGSSPVGSWRGRSFMAFGQYVCLSGVSGYFFYRETRLFVLGLDINTYTIYIVFSPCRI